jgi:hypothetical protein
MFYHSKTSSGTDKGDMGLRHTKRARSSWVSGAAAEAQRDCQRDKMFNISNFIYQTLTNKRIEAAKVEGCRATQHAAASSPLATAHA